MSNKYSLPYDIRMECIAYVRGYPRRVRAYNAAREEVLESSAYAMSGMPHSTGNSRIAERKAERLATIESWPETKKMRAVEYAMDNVGRDIANENVIANLKADADALRNKLADTEAALWRANAELGAAEGALREMNDKIVRCEAYSRTLRRDVNKMQLEKIGAIMRADYAEAHPWRNLWAWVKRKLVRHE